MYDVCDIDCYYECDDRECRVMKELVQGILVYIVIVSALKGLITSPKYSQYFQFFSGIVMILLLLTPILSVFDFETEWYQVLEEKILQMDLAEIEEEMQIADDRFADMLEKEYQKTAAEQIRAMAEQNGVFVEDAGVTLKRNGEEWAIEEITVTRKQTQEDGQGLSVEAVQMEGERQTAKEDTSKKAESLRKQICSYFVIGEDRVHIWK